MIRGKRDSRMRRRISVGRAGVCQVDIRMGDVRIIESIVWISGERKARDAWISGDLDVKGWCCILAEAAHNQEGYTYLCKSALDLTLSAEHSDVHMYISSTC